MCLCKIAHSFLYYGFESLSVKEYNFCLIFGNNDILKLLRSCKFLVYMKERTV
ncbi:hypothetical protein LEP1GSC198_3333 [Leptospira kirschneri str. JB]|nr:hypothetical protein LEP1GSC198_3333 [Leptospira kirschneri str. JB]